MAAADDTYLDEAYDEGIDHANAGVELFAPGISLHDRERGLFNE